jgi:hypothetical protein
VWLAQTPGPNVQPGSNPIGILAEDTMIQSGGNDWVTSWDGFWTPLSEKQANGTEALPEPSAAATGDGAELSTGGKAGIAIGVILCVAGISTAGVLVWRKGWTIRTNKPGFAGQGSEIALEVCHRGSTESGRSDAKDFRASCDPVEVAGSSMKDLIPLGEVDGSSSRRALTKYGRNKRSLYELA